MPASHSLARRIARDTGGTAMVEFAMGMPLFLVAIMGGLEVANMALAHQQVNGIAKMVADTSARGRATMDESVVQEIFLGAKDSNARLDFANRGRIILSTVANNAAGNGQWIVWQRCTGRLNSTSKYGAQDKGKSDGSLPAVGGKNVNDVQSVTGVTAPAANAIMFVEVEYTYKPLISSKFLGTPKIRSEATFVIRERNSFGITNTASRTVAACTSFNA